jgi:hypothetical protein
MKDDKLRGKSVWRSSTAAMLALAAVASHAPVAGQSPFSNFSPPASSLVLTRTIVRPLPDGKTITTRRDYEVRITRAGDGFRVDGALIDVAVDAPPSLLALAEIERCRPDTGLFPILLDASGMIAAPSGPQQSGSVSQAASLLTERIGSSGLPALDMLQAQAFVARLRAGTARSQWPNDVFHPAPGKRSEARKLALPGGGEGQVLIEIAGEGAGPEGQIAAVDRTVTTDLTGDRRVTLERWRISRAIALTPR